MKNIYMGKYQNNAYLDIINFKITFKADWAGFLNIAAQYCDVETTNKSVTLVDDVLAIKMQAGETIKISNTIGLKLLKFENSSNE